MRTLLSFHNDLFSRVDCRGGDHALATFARFVFAAVLLRFFWASAATKLDGPFSPTIGAYAQIFPRKFEAVGYDPSMLSILDALIVLAGAYSEFALPFLIVVGLLTRLSSLAMIGFVVVMSVVDVVGHGADAETVGALFDRHSGALIADQRLLWATLLLILVFKGAGPYSLDRGFGLK